MVVPIPCIIDTRAPAYFILGTGAINALIRQGLLIEKMGENISVLDGVVKKNGCEIDRPYASQLPLHYEDSITSNDVRFNLIGIYGLQELRYNIDF